MTDKEKYIDTIRSDKSIPVFMQPWWLDLITDRKWDVLLLEKNNKILAAMPYYIHKKYCFKTICQPDFTPYYGLYLHYPTSENRHTIYNFENEVMEYFAKQIDNMHLSACFYNLRPQNFFSTVFTQHYFQVSVRYTYKIDTFSDNWESSFSPVMRKKIRKASRELKENPKSADLRAVYEILKGTYTKQNKKITYPYELFERIVKESEARGEGKLFTVVDFAGNLCSALFVLWDKHTCYSLIGGTSEKFKKTNAGAFVQYLTIKYAREHGIPEYDTEGSMLKGVEEFFQHFGGIRTPYISLKKYYSILYKMARIIRK